MNTNQVHTQMILHDLETAGFEVRENSNGDVLVKLNRRVNTMEVRVALLEAGYSVFQFSLERFHNFVIVKVD